MYGVLVIILTLMAATYAKLSEKEPQRQTKNLNFIAVGAFFAAFIAWRLSLFFFTANPEYLQHFIMSVLMLAVLPAFMMGVSVASITSSNV